MVSAEPKGYLNTSSLAEETLVEETPASEEMDVDSTVGGKGRQLPKQKMIPIQQAAVDTFRLYIRVATPEVCAFTF